MSCSARIGASSFAPMYCASRRAAREPIAQVHGGSLHRMKTKVVPIDPVEKHASGTLRKNRS
jgi:hypothetical protein